MLKGEKRSRKPAGAVAPAVGVIGGGVVGGGIEGALDAFVVVGAWERGVKSGFDGFDGSKVLL